MTSCFSRSLSSLSPRSMNESIRARIPTVRWFEMIVWHACVSMRKMCLKDEWIKKRQRETRKKALFVPSCDYHRTKTIKKKFSSSSCMMNENSFLFTPLLRSLSWESLARSCPFLRCSSSREPSTKVTHEPTSEADGALSRSVFLSLLQDQSLCRYVMQTLSVLSVLHSVFTFIVLPWLWSSSRFNPWRRSNGWSILGHSSSEHQSLAGRHRDTPGQSIELTDRSRHSKAFYDRSFLSWDVYHRRIRIHRHSISSTNV